MVDSAAVTHIIVNSIDGTRKEVLMRDYEGLSETEPRVIIFGFLPVPSANWQKINTTHMAQNVLW